ncbi:hypothetical protein MMC22_011074, partial [Lobaria immixta]|nr:hypothetical protein [Lobaria immixta]
LEVWVPGSPKKAGVREDGEDGLWTGCDDGNRMDVADVPSYKIRYFDGRFDDYKIRYFPFVSPLWPLGPDANFRFVYGWRSADGR